MTWEALQTGMCVWGVEIPTITIFQIQRLLVSEQRNNKFNQRWSLKGKERRWVLERIPPPRRKYLHLLCQHPELGKLQADHGAQFGLFCTDLTHAGTHAMPAYSHSGLFALQAGNAAVPAAALAAHRLLAGARHSMPRFFFSTVKQCQLTSSSIQISVLNIKQQREVGGREREKKRIFFFLKKPAPMRFH